MASDRKLLQGINKALDDYHYALDIRTHGLIAADRCIKAIELIMGNPWKQGEELKKRKL